jgi:hypothetical protein
MLSISRVVAFVLLFLGSHAITTFVYSNFRRGMDHKIDRVKVFSSYQQIERTAIRMLNDEISRLETQKAKLEEYQMVERDGYFENIESMLNYVLQNEH